MSNDLDLIDRKIIRVLTENGRISWRDLSDKIGLSLTPTIRRVKRLESEGYIYRYTIALSPKRLVGTTNGIISLWLKSHSRTAIEEFENAIINMEDVIYCTYLGGDPDYMLNVIAEGNYEFQEKLTRITALPHVDRVQSRFALRVVVRRALLPAFTD